MDLKAYEYYRTDLGTLYCGDCLEIMPHLPKVDLVLTSPPYDNLRIYKGFKFDFERTAFHISKLLKLGSVLVWIVGDETKNGTESGTSFEQALFFKIHMDLNLHDTMIYHKNSPPLTHNRYEQHFEYMFVFSKGKPKTFNPLYEQKLYEDKRTKKSFRRENDGSMDFGFPKKDSLKIKGNVWFYKVGGGHDSMDTIAYKHPAIFPEKLASDHIYSWSNENDLILDPMCGSGTTLKMANAMNRRWLGIEISEEYCEIAKQRLEKEVRQGKLFPVSKPEPLKQEEMF